MGWQLPFTFPCIEFASERKAINNVSSVVEVHFGQGGTVWSILWVGRAWLGNNRNLSGVRNI